jgi:hypothetical protein
MIISVPVQTAVCQNRASGQAFPVEVETQESVVGLYRPPVSRYAFVPLLPPQTIISVPVQTPEANFLPMGQFGPVDVGVHVSVEGLYRLPTLRYDPPQTIISVPVQTVAGRLWPSNASLRELWTHTPWQFSSLGKEKAKADESL